MLVSDLVSQYQNSTSSGSKISTKTKGIEQLSKTVASLEKGQIFEGTVNSVKGGKVTLALSSGQTITASIDKAIKLLAGQSVFFQVKSNEGGVVEIRPVNSEFGGNPTLLNALKSAGLPENEANLKLINAMMKEQMPVDAASIKDMIRTMKNNPGTEVDTLVSMKKLDIPITPSMITQFENYKQSEGAILKMVNELSNDIPKAFMGENVTKGDLAGFQNDLLGFLENSINKEFEGELIQTLKTPVGEQGSLETIGQTIGQDVKQAPGQVTEQLAAGGTEQQLAAGATEQTTGQQIPNGDKGIAISTTLEPKISENPQTGGVTSLGTNHDLDIPSVKQGIGTLKDVLNPQSAVTLERMISEFPEIKTMAPQLFDEEGKLKSETKVSDFLKTVNNVFLNASTVTKEDMIKFLDSKPVKTMINDMMGKAWTLEPRDLLKKNVINELYEKIENDMEKIINSSKHNTHEMHNPISDTASLVKDNLSFIREVNQLYQYVQIPLQMAGEKTTGELFVYANKKQKRAENDEITAFLHFDLESLGSTDIAVKLAGKKLDTKFFLEDDISFQIVEKHLPELEERLEKIGYDCKLKVVNDSNKINFVEDFLKQDSKTAGTISRYSFDVRA